MTKLTEYNQTRKIRPGDILLGRRTGAEYDVREYNETAWGHGIYHLVNRETGEKRTIADFALYRKYEFSRINFELVNELVSRDLPELTECFHQLIDGT